MWCNGVKDEVIEFADKCMNLNIPQYIWKIIIDEN